ncbi:unnamed protein product [Brassicogethes aeneus]|uniref:Phospholipid/glycerol acyltransferase domain-containing protein n=1 Tax=Brassicogethes aeneus TaxID=1431903 RepID=A0A9P0BB58_BRAAE|nr:unnamed protein product [Brassicogethes aeneus]
MSVVDVESLKKNRVLHLCLAITFFCSGLIINVIQCILYLTLHKVNKPLYRRVNKVLTYCIFSQLSFLGDYWSNTTVYHYVDKDVYDKYFGKEHAFCIMNHSYDVDWVPGWMVCDRLGMLGNCKAYAKSATKYIPVLGWCWKFGEFVFLERNFEKDKENIHQQIGELADYPEPVWLLLFPEGTRFTPEKQKASVEFAAKSGKKALKYHLIPRTKGFIASLPRMQGKIHALYDVEVAYKEEETKPTITNMLMGKSLKAHMYYHRIPMEEVPKTEEGQDQFLRDLFDKKDRMRESFAQTGDFFATSGVERVEPFTVPRSTLTLINLVFWATVVLVPIAYCLLKWLVTGQFLAFGIVVGLIGALYVMMTKVIGMSKTEKGSSYGSSTPKKTN